MQAAASTTRSLLERSISVLGAAPGPIISLALIVHLPTLALGLTLGPEADPAELAEQSAALAAVAVAAGVLVIVLEALATAVMAFGVIQVAYSSEGGDP